MGTHFFLLTDFFFIHRDVLEINRLDKIARRSKRIGGAIADLWGPKKSPYKTYGKKRKMLPLLRFFCEKIPALEINRLDKIARRSKRVGGAIADLWGGQYLCFVY